jgi:hypothetical protein
MRKTGSGENERSIEQHFTLDGRESKNQAPWSGGYINSAAEIKDNILVIQNTQTIAFPDGDREMRSQEEFSLADDGQTLIIKTTRPTPDGERTFKQVFTRR